MENSLAYSLSHADYQMFVKAQCCSPAQLIKINIASVHSMSDNLFQMKPKSLCCLKKLNNNWIFNFCVTFVNTAIKYKTWTICNVYNIQYLIKSMYSIS